MPSIKISALPNFSGNTTGSYLVMNDSESIATYKVTRETLFSGSLFGTSSWAISSSRSSYSDDSNLFDGLNSTQFARLDQGNLFLGNQTVVGDINSVNQTITGTLTAQKIVVQTITSSRDYVTGSTIFGSDIDLNTHQFTGSVNITGSLTSNTKATLPNLTGSLFGTSSWALNTIYSETSSYSTALGASLTGVSNDKVRLLASDGGTLSTVTISQVTSSLTSSYSTTLGASVSTLSNDKVQLVSSNGSILSTTTISAVTSSLTSSYSTALGASLTGVSNDKVRLLSSNGATLGSDVTISQVTSSFTASSADSGFFVRGNTTLGNSLANIQKVSGSLFITGSTIINDPAGGATGESLIVAKTLKLDASGTGQSPKVYILSDTLSDNYAGGVQIQVENLVGGVEQNKGFGFNLNTSGDFELYTKNTSWFKGLVVTKSGQNVQVSSGSLGVSGSSSITGSLNVRQNVSFGSSLSNTHQMTGSLYITGSGGSLTSPTLRVAGSTTITGSLAVGNISPNAASGRIEASNDIIAYSTSDERLKENIKPIENSLEKISLISGVEYDWKKDFKDIHGYEGHDIGVIAQEIQKVIPEATRTNDSGYLSVRYERIIPLLIEAIKEQQKQIEELKNSLLNK